MAAGCSWTLARNQNIIVENTMRRTEMQPEIINYQFIQSIKCPYNEIIIRNSPVNPLHFPVSSGCQFPRVPAPPRLQHHHNNNNNNNSLTGAWKSEYPALNTTTLDIANLQRHCHSQDIRYIYPNCHVQFRRLALKSPPVERFS